MIEKRRPLTRAEVSAGSRVGKLIIRAIDTVEGRSMADCVCDCGRSTRTRLSRILSGKTLSCGCLRGRFSHNGGPVRHGHARPGHETPTYRSWKSMRDRCQHQSSRSWEDYGGRGISVCARWESFEAFLEDMGERPSDAHSIDRIDPNGNYTPENCRWADAKVQGRNTRANRILTHEGRAQPVAAWVEETGLSYSTIEKRLRRGWSVADAISTPYLGRGGRR